MAGNIFNAERDNGSQGIKIDDSIRALDALENLDSTAWHSIMESASNLHYEFQQFHY